MLGRDAFEAAGRYLKRNPDEALRAVRGALGLKFGVPLQAFRWLADQLLREGAKDLRIEAVPPGLRVTGNLVLMKTPLRASAVVYIEKVNLSDEEMRLELRLEEVTLELVGKSETPLGALVASGSLDLSKPGDLAKFMPKLPPVIADAYDNRFVIDLMRVPKLGGSAVVRRSAALLTSLVTVRTVQTDSGHLDVALRPLPQGVIHAATSVSKHLIGPGWRRMRLLLPGGRA